MRHGPIGWTRHAAGHIAKKLRPVARATPLPLFGGGEATAITGVQLSQRLGYRLQNSRFAGSPSPGQTLANLIHLEAEPVWLRLVYINDGPEPWTIDGAAIAPTTEPGNGFDPMNQAGATDPGLWRRVGFTAQGRDSEPPLDRLTEGAAPDRAIELTVPGNPLDGSRPVHVVSDWMPLKALPRRDGGVGWLLLVRTFSKGSIRFAASVGLPDPAIGLLHCGFSADGDRTDPSNADPSSHGPHHRNDRLFACHGVHYVSPMAGATVIGIGDSIIHSSCTSGEMSGFGIRACAMLSRPERPVSYVNEGFPGRNSLGFCTNGLWAIDTFRPQVAIIQAWSRNEPWTSEMADTAFARAIAVADATRRHGGVPILTTAAPVFHDDPEADRVRRASNGRVRALARQGVPVLDLDAQWGTGREPNTYRPEFDAGDHWHPNDRACAVTAGVLAPMLQRILGS